MARTKEEGNRQRRKAAKKAKKVLSNGKRKHAKKKNDEKKKAKKEDDYFVDVSPNDDGPKPRYMRAAVGQVWARDNDSSRKIKITGLLENKRVSYEGDRNYHVNLLGQREEFGPNDRMCMSLITLGNNYTLQQNVITLKFQYPNLMSATSRAHTVTVKTNSIIGDVVKQIPFLKLVKAMSLGEENTFFGYDLDLSKPFSHYVGDFRIGLAREVTVYTFSHLAVHQTQWNIKYPLMYFDQKLAWPPENAVNWKEGDAINLAPFLVWLGWGSGSTNPPAPEQDNHWEHLVVLKYPNGVAKVVNWLAWGKGSNEGKRDPLTNNKLDPPWYKDTLIKLMLDVQKNGRWVNRPLPVLTLQYPLRPGDYVRFTESDDNPTHKNRIGYITDVYDDQTYDIKWCERRWDIQHKSKKAARSSFALYTVPTFKVGDPVRDLDCEGDCGKRGTVVAKYEIMNVKNNERKLTYDICWNHYNPSAIVAMERDVDPAILQPDPEQPVALRSGARVYSHFEIGEGVERIERGLNGELQYGVITSVDSINRDGVLVESYNVRFLHPGAGLWFQGSLTPKLIRRYNGNVWETRDHPYEVGDDVYRVGSEQQTGTITKVISGGSYNVHWDDTDFTEECISHHDLRLNGKNHAFDECEQHDEYDVGMKVIHIRTGRRGKIVDSNWDDQLEQPQVYDVEWLNAKYPEKRVSHMVLARQTKYYWSKWVRGRRVRYNHPMVWNDFSTDAGQPVGTITDVGYQGGTKFKIRWDKGGRTMNYDAYERDKLWLLPLKK